MYFFLFHKIQVYSIYRHIEGNFLEQCEKNNFKIIVQGFLLFCWQQMKSVASWWHWFLGLMVKPKAVALRRSVSRYTVCSQRRAAHILRLQKEICFSDFSVERHGKGFAQPWLITQDLPSSHLGEGFADMVPWLPRSWTQLRTS